MRSEKKSLKMLYGNMIFIKKTGGDGSKYPVTERNVKIGRSENCLIRIHNPQVEPEHCQLIIDDNGQAKLRNLSKATVLNGKPLAQKDVTLCHGDVFKLGERLARWEYLPSSKYYRHLLSPTGRLLAIVIPQRRSTEDLVSSGASTSEVSESRSTPLRGKRRYTERGTIEGGSSKKMLRMSSGNPSQKSMSNMVKFLAGRHSLHGTKLLFSPKPKERKSTSGIVVSDTSKAQENIRKSTLPSWKVNIVSPAKRRSVQRKSTPIKKPLPGKLNEKILKSVGKSAGKTNLKTIVESPRNEKGQFTSSQRNSSKSPQVNTSEDTNTSDSLSSAKTKEFSTSVGLINSGKKLSFSARKSSPSKKSSLSKEWKRLSLAVDPKEKTPRKSVLKKTYETHESVSLSSLQRDMKNFGKNSPGKRNSDLIVRMAPSVEIIDLCEDEIEMHSPVRYSALNTSVKSTPMEKISRKSSRASEKSSSSVRVSEKLKLEKEKTPSVINQSPVRKNLNSSIRSSATRNLSATKRRSSDRVDTPVRKSLPQLKEKTVSKGTPRKFSTSISSAERAAKKLKTSSPRKPDKNKKAALLVLGKANRKQILSQNVKVLLKQKIVKKAMKQSTVAPILKKDNAIKTLGKIAKKPTKGKTKQKKKTAGKKSLGKKIVLVKDSNVKVLDNQNTSLRSSGVLKTQVSVEETPKNKKDTEENMSRSSFHSQKSPSLSSKTRISDSKPTSKSPAKQISTHSKKSDLFRLSISPFKNSASNVSFVDGSSDKREGNYSYSSNRRCSKRLSSKNDVSRPDYMELSPTALGLMPKKVEEVFKTPKDKRRSSSMTTPKNIKTTGIIKSASTSKIGNRKSVRFSSKDMFSSSMFSTPNTTQGTDFDFEAVETPNITMDVFVSPLVERKFNSSKDNWNDSARVLTFAKEADSDAKETSVRTLRTSSEPSKYARKVLQSPRSPRSTKKVLPSSARTSRTSLKSSVGPKSRKVNLKSLKSPKNDLNDVKGVRQLFSSPKQQKSPKNDLSNVVGVRRLLRTPRGKTSPKNDLSDVRGVKKLLQSPRIQKSPKNELTDLRGVKKLLTTPRLQKSPKNDLTDLRGVRQMLGSPRTQKSPKNDLSDVGGVPQLFKSPRVQKSPKNDLTDVKGVKKLLQTPRVQRSPKNDLTDLRGVRQLLKTPQVQKSPKNSLTDLSGVKQLLKTPRAQKSPKNNLTDFVGVQELLRSPRTQKSPKNDLSDVAGVRKLFSSPRLQRSPKNNLLDISGVGQLFDSPKVSQALKKEVESEQKLVTVTPTQRSLKISGVNSSGVKQLLIAKSPSKSADNSASKSVSRKSELNNLRNIRGRRTIYTCKSPKNDLRDVRGVRELFLRHKPTNDLNISLTGVAQLFDFLTPKVEANKKQEATKSQKKVDGEIGKEGKVKALKGSKLIKVEDNAIKEAVIHEEIATRRGRLRKAAAEIEKKSTRRQKVSEVEGTTNESRLRKRKATEELVTSKPKKTAKVSVKEVKKTTTARAVTKRAQKKVTSESSVDKKSKTKSSQVEKKISEVSERSPRKLRSRQAKSELTSPKTVRKVASVKAAPSAASVASEDETLKGKKIPGKSESSKTTKKLTTVKVQSKTSKATKAGKTSANSVQKVQKTRSQSQSNEKKSKRSDKVSPRKTRSVNGKSVQEKKSQVETARMKILNASGRKKVSPAVKRSTRRK